MCIRDSDRESLPSAIQSPAPPQPYMAPPASSLFLALPDELRLHIAGMVSKWQDRAALCLACPPLGVTAIRTIEVYEDPLLAVAIALWHRSPSSVLNEQCFRRYAASYKASDAAGARPTDRLAPSAWGSHLPSSVGHNARSLHTNAGPIRFPLTRRAGGVCKTTHPRPKSRGPTPSMKHPQVCGPK